MEHTFTLSNEGFISPCYMRDRSPRVVGVSHPRTLELEGMTLRLLDGEPDLPVGSQVQVWLQRWFHCETLDYIQAKKDEADRQAAARRAHEESVTRQAVEVHLAPTQSLIAGNPAPAVLKSHLEALYAVQESEHATYRRYWHARNPEDKQKSNDAYQVSSTIAQAIHELSIYVFGQLAKQGIQGKVAYAYSPREGARDGFFSPGKDHYQLLTPVADGRYKRASGDALCKPSAKFWGLQGFDDGRPVTCRQCLDRMLKLLK